MKALKMYWNNLTLLYKIIGLFAVPLLIVVSTIFSQALFNEMADPEFSLCLLYTSPSPRDMRRSRMPSSA